MEEVFLRHYENLNINNNNIFKTINKIKSTNEPTKDPKMEHQGNDNSCLKESNFGGSSIHMHFTFNESGLKIPRTSCRKIASVFTKQNHLEQHRNGGLRLKTRNRTWPAME